MDVYRNVGVALSYYNKLIMAHCYILEGCNILKHQQQHFVLTKGMWNIVGANLSIQCRVALFGYSQSFTSSAFKPGHSVPTMYVWS